jgi:hypothetical protein
MGWKGKKQKVSTKKMILYTEKQLRDAYHNHKILLKKNKIDVPTLEEFRLIFEDYYKDYYGGQGEQKKYIN